jgi:radical SAM superfamily enzyme YgiQ (UPF0313 family)
MIHFLDDIIFSTNQRLHEFVVSCKSINIYSKFMWRGLCSLEALNRLDENLLEMSNCYSLSIGIESGSDKVLQRIGKQYSSVDIRNILSGFIGSKIKFKAFFMVGTPGETPEDILLTKDLVRWLRDSQVVKDINVFQFKPYPRTQLYNEFYSNSEIEYKFMDLRDKWNISNYLIDRALGKDFYFSIINGNIEKLRSEIEDIISITQLFYDNNTGEVIGNG